MSYASAARYRRELTDSFYAGATRRILELRKQGMKQREIAELFDRENVPNQSGMYWHAGLVSRLEIRAKKLAMGRH